MEFRALDKVGPLDIILFSEGEVNIMDPNAFLNAIFEATLNLKPLKGTKCTITGEEAMGIQTSKMQVLLRPDIIQRLGLLELSRQEWKTLKDIAPDECMLGTACYNCGYAIQGKLKYMPESRMYVPFKARPKTIDKAHTPNITSSIQLG